MKKQTQKTEHGYARTSVAWMAALALMVGAAPLPAKASAPDALDLTISVPAAGTSFTLPLNGTYTGVTINWGDGASGPGNVKTHLYAAAGSYDIQVSAQATGTIGLGLTGLAGGRAWTGSDLVTRVTAWNNLSTMKGAFAGALNLQSVPNYLPSSVTLITNMFNGAASFNSDISGWDVSRITDLTSLFQGATSFNQNISGWNTSAVTSLQSTFNGATSFNQPIGSWNTSSVTSFANTFSGASSFNQPLSQWDTSAATTMPFMFSGASSFNQPIGNWNVSRVTMYSGMFANAVAFNQPLTGWNTTAGSYFDTMFQGATGFNQSLATMNVKGALPASTLGGMLTGSGISAANLSDTLQGWARGWTVGSNSYTVPRSVTTAWQLKYLGDAATLAAVSTLTTTYGWNLAAETSSRMVSYTISPGTGITPATTATAVANQFAVAQASGFSRPGYTFTSWTDGTNNYAAGANYPAGSSAVSLAAQWSANTLNVTLDARNGSPATTITTQTDVQISSAPAAPTRTGYSFAGWFRSSTGGTRISFPYSHGQTTDFTLYAQWTALPQTVTYLAGTGSGNPPTQADVVSGRSFVLADAATLSKTGYTFADWSDGASVYQPGATYTVGTSAVILTATWTASAITVSFDPANGSAVTTQTSHTDEQIASAPSDPTRAGYAFQGWFVAASGGSRIAFPYAHGQVASFALYAHWNALPHSVSFALAGATGTTPAQSDVTTDARFVVAGSSGFARSGYSFIGWSDGNSSYQPGDSYLGGSSSVTLTALWQANTLTVRFDPTNGSAITSQTIRTDEALAAPTAPTLAGYRFIGWFTSAVGGTAVSFPYAHGHTSNFTLYAHWSLIPTSQISFTLNGGTGELPAPIVMAVGSRLTIMGSMAISRVGYEFTGWSDGTNLYAPDSQIVFGPTDITLAPQWRKVTEDSTAPAGGGATPAPVKPTPAPVKPTPLPVSSVVVKLSLGSGKPTHIGQAALTQFAQALVGYPDIAKYSAKISVAFGAADGRRSGSDRQALVAAALARLRATAEVSGVKLAIDPSVTIAPATASTDRYSKLVIRLIPVTD